MGKKRRELVMRVGYDSKNAAHLIRLLRMGIEFLTEGTMYVERFVYSTSGIHLVSRTKN